MSLICTVPYLDYSFQWCKSTSCPFPFYTISNCDVDIGLIPSISKTIMWVHAIISFNRFVLIFGFMTEQCYLRIICDLLSVSCTASQTVEFTV